MTDAEKIAVTLERLASHQQSRIDDLVLRGDDEGITWGQVSNIARAAGARDGYRHAIEVLRREEA